MKQQQSFDSVAFFRKVKRKMAKLTEGKNLEETRLIWKQIREGKIKI